MQPRLKETEILNKSKLAPEVYYLELSAPELAERAQPGQFLHLKCGREGYDPLLRRPLSIFSIDVSRGTLGLLFRIRGRGTELLASRKPGEKLEVLGPAGRGFKLKDQDKRLLVVAGGMGVAPLASLAQLAITEGRQVTMLLGAVNSEELVALNFLSSLGIKPRLATDDGSRGFKGQVTSLAERLLKVEDFDHAYACGPRPMLRTLAQLAQDRGLVLQISLEERMGCGVGACLTCACAVHDGRERIYQRVCSEGPVFSADEVIFDD